MRGFHVHSTKYTKKNECDLQRIFLHNLIYQVLFPEFFLQLVIKHKLYCSVGDIDQVRNQTLKDTKTK